MEKQTTEKGTPNEEIMAIQKQIDELNDDAQFWINHDNPSQIEKIRKEIAVLNEKLYKKVGEQLGTNEGGWYENQATREKFYLKFYKNPDQGKMEYIANAIYKKLGIKAVESFLIQMGDRIAVASKELEGGGETISEEEQAESNDIRSGFIADAYLANWDVVGLVFDNIIKDAKDDVWRIDNGGSLTFRAQGKPKDFSPNDIPELENMLNPEYSAGQVFGEFSEEELREQAEHLVMSLTEKDIDTIVRQSELDEEQTKNIKTSLIGRRRFLIKKFNIETKPSERVMKAIERLQEQKESKEAGLRPRVGILADTDKIENQEIDIIDARDMGKYEINFKLTEDCWRTLIAKFQREGNTGKWSRGDISYTRAPNNDVEKDEEEDDDMSYYNDSSVKMADAIVIETNGSTVKISRREDRRSFLGLVHIEIESGGKDFSIQEISEKVNTVFEEILGIEQGLIIPPESAEKNYKKARYAWQHKINPDDVSEEIVSKLERKEVLPGYFTFVEQGKHQEYQSLSPYVVLHNLYTQKTVSKIFKAGGLLSSHERYRRGLLSDGCSTEADLNNGGGDSVFTRTITREGLKSGGYDERARFYTGNDCIILFHPRIFDRTDWYAYPSDEYGTTDPWKFEDRQTPEQVFSEQKEKGYSSCNEQMFRQGISSDDFLAIIFDDVSDMLKMARQLRGDGVTTTQGVPIEEKIALIETYGDLLKISGGEEAMTLSRLIKENSEKVLEGEWKYVLLMTNNIEHWADKGNAYAKRFLEWKERGLPNFPADWDINFLLESIENFSKNGLAGYVKENFGDVINIADIPEKFKADMLAKLKLLLGSLTNLIASFHKSKNIPFYITDNLEEYTRCVKKIKKNIAPIIKSLEKPKN
jgi:hypothetical protein